MNPEKDTYYYMGTQKLKLKFLPEKFESEQHLSEFGTRIDLVISGPHILLINQQLRSPGMSPELTRLGCRD